MVEHAEHLPYGEFRICVQRWEALADVDGAHRGHEAAHAGRSAHASIVGDEFRLDANGGVHDGAAITEILRRLEQAEFDADWAELRDRFGDDDTPSMLERTAAQRRFDALRAIFDKAASTMPGARAPEPVVNIVVDQATFEAWVAGGADGPMPDVDVDARRSETTDGVRSPPPTPSPSPFAATCGGW